MREMLIIFKKELKRFLTDRRMVITLILPGVLIFILYSIMGMFMTDYLTGDYLTGAEEYVVYIKNEPSALSAITDTDAYDITVYTEYDLSEEEIKEGIMDESIHLYVVFEENFWEGMLAYEVSSGETAPQVELYYNSLSVESELMYSYYVACLNAIEQSLANKFDINAGTEEYDLSTDSDLSSYILSMMLPMLLNTLLLSGCMAVSSESIAGEKERGTVATLLVTPASRGSIAAGKVLALSLVSLISSVCSFVGLILSLPSLMGVSFSALPYALGDYLIMLLIILLSSLLFTALLTVVSAFAKSVKESNSMASVVMIIVVVVSLMASLISYEGIAGYFIPVFNTVLCFTGILSSGISIAGLLITVGVNVAVFALLVLLLAKMFDSERIMFNR